MPAQSSVIPDVGPQLAAAAAFVVSVCSAAFLAARNVMAHRLVFDKFRTASVALAHMNRPGIPGDFIP